MLNVQQYFNTSTTTSGSFWKAHSRDLHSSRGSPWQICTPSSSAAQGIRTALNLPPLLKKSSCTLTREATSVYTVYHHPATKWRICGKSWNSVHHMPWFRRKEELSPFTEKKAAVKEQMALNKDIQLFQLNARHYICFELKVYKKAYREKVIL